MNQFTIQAQRALQLAIEAAEELGHHYIGTEHILLGLRREGTAVAAKVLQSNGIDNQKILDMIAKFISSDQKVAIRERAGYTPSAKRVMENAMQESIRTGARLVGTEHILIAMLKDSNCVASRIIATLGGNAQRMYQQIIAVLGDDIVVDDTARPQTAPPSNTDTPTLEPVSYTHLTLPTTK